MLNLKNFTLLGTCMAVMVCPVFGATLTFDGSSSSDWNVAANWDGNVVPTVNDHVIIPSGKTCEIKSANAGANDINIASTAVLNIAASYTMTMDNDGLVDSVVSGTMNLQGSASKLEIIDDDHLISGSGKIIGMADDAVIDHTSGTGRDFTNQVTIEGNVKIIGDVFHNEGTVKANGNGVLWINTAKIVDTTGAIWRTDPYILPGAIPDGPTLRIQDTTTNDAEEELNGSFIISATTSLDVDAGICTDGTLTWNGGASIGSATARFSGVCGS